ncbi:MAG TPA: tRNA (N(6)-L-threonylcarbamoyladenosine(37)-C(2))-methylthiotransferase MtaB [Alphaproteobacteria bacterium]|nr:tRNA (N(6)-L-threonylcarbamoyladenosine(37)-C(2))-methylthiotransferase MtaB [Alphaproteobacteria bacterium]USO06417.1 MAG: tRNA (N(6)-L-threonylcarbamoyladenosine(37)-C(2))-methylthiotransferase MtaB [Rhodospirillales bacterium]HOO81817.1 tRNA (N(6)-L-threonylcarbamoyladenosine(37)-C(2))-methylthiotransferase MtaB [Alphaproteobacteria bacterium]
MDQKSPKLVTFGCRLNTYESEVMRTHAANAGLDDAIIFNTCAVTKEAERQARQAIRRARRENPNAKIIVTGCSAQITPDTYAAMPEVDQIIGNDLKLKAESWGVEQGEKVMVNDIMSVTETASHLIEGFEDRSRAFLQVQNGCDHRCTFCIIPYGRGPSRSVPIGVIAEHVRALVEQGYNEIVFTGVDVTSYGPDLPGAPTLGQMIRRVLALVPELPRLRLSSLDPVEIDDDLWRLIAEEPRLMPHLHLSLQAGDDMILKRMKRRHLRNDVIAMCQRARTLRPDIEFGADIITGFPTETEEMFQNTLKIVEECDLTYLHVFPYSERKGTPAARIPGQVPPKERKERAARLRALGELQLQKLLRRNLNKEAQIIVEKGSFGRTQNFSPVHLNAKARPGDLLSVKLSGITGENLLGEPL